MEVLLLLQVKVKKAEKEAVVVQCREEQRTLASSMARMRDSIAQAAGTLARKQAELEAHEGTSAHLHTHTHPCFVLCLPAIHAPCYSVSRQQNTPKSMLFSADLPNYDGKKQFAYIHACRKNESGTNHDA